MNFKNVIILTGILLLFSYAHSQDNMVSSTAHPEKATIVWDTTIYNFNEITPKKPVKASFEFVNKSKKPVSIINVHASCGCTVATYSNEPVLPEQSGQVSVTFDAAKYGAFNKLVTVFMSDNSQHRLRLKGTVGAKPKRAGG
ncbi:MAG: DUF1573 domain-containing protein [Bacteroidales bacterium]|nr:DUF1573 domain-containing protein [Bacteroidales bacterium]